MQAVIMAGGEGTRLRPLTLRCPKPLAPVLGEPAMSHIIRMLARHGVRRAAVTLMFMPEKITRRYGEEFEGVELRYFVEKTPLGTAGSVKSTEAFLREDDSGDDSFLIVSGDAVCDIDLTAAIEHHRSSGADATLVLSRVDAPLEYGVVLTQGRGEGGDYGTGRILRFIEKPGWQQAYADTVNTGIYILRKSVLDLIPSEGQYDFGKDLFKKLMGMNANLQGFASDGYWCDIGDIGAYYTCNMDALQGKIGGIRKPEFPVYVGANTRISDDALVFENTIIGSKCNITHGVSLRESIVHDGVFIGAGSVIEGAIICRGAVICEDVRIPRGCVIGENAIIGKKAVLSPGVRIWADKTVGEGININTSLVFGDVRRELFDDYGISGRVESSLTPEYCVRLGAACAAAVKNKDTAGRVGVIHRGSPSSRLIADALLCGIRSGGAKSYDFASGFDAMAAYTAGHFRLDVLFYVDDITTSQGHENYIKIYDRDTLSPVRAFERKLEANMTRDDFARRTSDQIYPTEVFDGLKFLYFSELIKSSTGRLDGFKCRISSPELANSGSAAHLMAKAVTELGGTVYDAGQTDEADITTFAVGSDGLTLEVWENGRKTADFWHIAAILQQIAITGGLTQIALPYLAPYALQSLAEDMGAQVLRYLSCPADENDEDDRKARELVFSQIFLKDACFAGLKLCEALHAGKTSVTKLLEKLPQFEFVSDDYPSDQTNKTFIIGRLSGQAEQSTARQEGIRLQYANGKAHVVPLRSSGFRLYAEAVSTEAASEIISDIKARLREIDSLR